MKNKVKPWAVFVWLAVWQLASMAVGKEILLVSPVRTLVRLGELCMQGSFWRAVGYTLARIALGFLLATIAGVTLAALGAKFSVVRDLMTPFMLTVKAIPVASFIIVALIWFSSKRLSVLISFLMVLPIIYTNTLDGLMAVDRKLVEMAKVFCLPKLFRGMFILWPQVKPFFCAGVSLGLGLAWKSGIAAEVIGIPVGSIGEKLQRAKAYLETPDVFAWTLTIVVISTLCEKLVMRLLRRDIHKVPVWPKRKNVDAVRDISLKHVQKSFDGNVVLDDVSLTIAPGETVALMAPSGAGKTTLVNILLKLLKPDVGNVDGADGLIGTVFQEDRLVEHMDAVGNIRLANSRLNNEYVLEEMKKMGLFDCESKPVSALSGGMRRRVCLLRALMSQANMLVLDEPFNGLDEETKNIAIERTMALQNERAILLVTHDLDAARRMGARIVHLKGVEP